MMEGEIKEKEAEGKKIVHTYPLIKVSFHLLIFVIIQLNLNIFYSAFRYDGGSKARGNRINCYGL